MNCVMRGRFNVVTIDNQHSLRTRSNLSSTSDCCGIYIVGELINNSAGNVCVEDI